MLSGSSSARACWNASIGYRAWSLARVAWRSLGSAGISSLAQCSTALYLGSRRCSTIRLYLPMNSLVTASRSSSLPASSGRYMMIPTQLWSDSGVPEQGDMLLELPLVQRCSIGLGAGILFLLISLSSSSIYEMSHPLGWSLVPHGNATSNTHCWPPQSNPRISSLYPTRIPSFDFQNAASALLIDSTHDGFNGSWASSTSRHSVGDRSSGSCPPSSIPLVDLTSSRNGLLVCVTSPLFTHAAALSRTVASAIADPSSLH
mmetsp:Transcript_4631/g.13180  ORF Transcript_4631/g.13180 Transcript_4631/m.13180 type:complete len:260 (+) Transcript_4631:1231-2010(+)